MAAHAAGANESRTPTVMVEDDGLVTAIVARHLTAAASHAQLMVELRIYDGIAIERVGLQEQWQRLANE